MTKQSDTTKSKTTRPDSPHDKPDAKAVRDREQAEAHVEAREAEREGANEDDGVQPGDAEHGYSQDAGYAQSGGHRKEPTPRDASGARRG